MELAKATVAEQLGSATPDEAAEVPILPPHGEDPPDPHILTASSRPQPDTTISISDVQLDEGTSPQAQNIAGSGLHATSEEDVTSATEAPEDAGTSNVDSGELDTTKKIIRPVDVQTVAHHLSAIASTVGNKPDRNTNTQVPLLAVRKAKAEARKTAVTQFGVLLKALEGALVDDLPGFERMFKAYLTKGQIETSMFGTYQPAKRTRGTSTRFVYTPTIGFEPAIERLVGGLTTSTAYPWSKTLLFSLALTHRYKLDPTSI